MHMHGLAVQWVGMEIAEEPGEPLKSINTNLNP